MHFLWFALDPAKVVTINKGHDLSWYTAEPVDLSRFGIPHDAMQKLYDDPALRQDFGKRARAHIATHFSHEDTVSKTLSLYQEILTGQGRRARQT